MNLKTQQSNKCAFTLIELLVVIVIIAVLAAAGFAGGTAAMNRARKASAQTVATSIATSSEQFYLEYSALPVPEGGTTTNLSTGPDGKGTEVLNILSANESATPIQNVRKIRFFNAKDAKGTRDGATYNGTSNQITALYDPFGQPYFIELDGDYDDVVNFELFGTTVNLRGKRVAAYSLGVPAGTESNSAKLAKSW